MLLYFGLICVSIILLLLIYLKVYKPMQKWKDLGIPYKKPLPFLGNMASIVLQKKSAADWSQDLYNVHETSRYIGLHAFCNHTALILKDLDLIKQMNIIDFDYFDNHHSSISDDMDPISGKSLYNLKGQKWRNMRSILSPAFTASKMQSMFVLMSDCAEQFTNYFKEEIKSGQSMTVEMKDIFTRYGIDITATCAFGITCNSMKDKNNEFYEMGKDISNFGGIRAFKIIGYNIYPKLMKMLNIKIFNDRVVNFFRNIISSTIKNREEQGIIRPDMIHLLMEARKGKLKHEDSTVNDEDAGFATVEESHIGKEKQDTKNNLSDDDIAAQTLFFFCAGYDKICITMCHMAYELALNEDVQQKLQEEIDNTFKECKGKLTYDAVLKMKYLDMVLSETLRKWPAVPGMDRFCNDSYTIPAKNPGERPIHLKKNDIIWIPCFGLHRDPKYFPNPDSFDPERFNDENKVNIKPLSYMPFGVGPRNCIASRFALLEAKVVFCYMLSKFTFEICEKSQVPLKISKKLFNLSAENGFWLALKPRN